MLTRAVGYRYPNGLRSQRGCLAMLTFGTLWNPDFKIGFLHLAAQLWRRERTSGALTLLLRFGQCSAVQIERNVVPDACLLLAA